MSKYPLCEQLGFKTYSAHQLAASHPDMVVVSVRQVEDLIEAAPVVYGGAYPGRGLGFDQQPIKADTTHSARLLMIRPLREATVEDVLRKVVHAWEHEGSDHGDINLAETMRMARSFLEAK